MFEHRIKSIVWLIKIVRKLLRNMKYHKNASEWEFKSVINEEFEKVLMQLESINIQHLKPAHIFITGT